MGNSYSSHPPGSLGLSGGTSNATSTVRAQSSGRAIKKPLGQQQIGCFQSGAPVMQPQHAGLKGGGRDFTCTTNSYGLGQVHLVIFISM